MLQFRFNNLRAFNCLQKCQKVQNAFYLVQFWYSFRPRTRRNAAASTHNKAPASTLGDMSRNLFSAALARRAFGRSTARAPATSNNISAIARPAFLLCVLDKDLLHFARSLDVQDLSSCNGMLVNKVLASDLTL